MGGSCISTRRRKKQKRKLIRFLIFFACEDTAFNKLKPQFEAERKVEVGARKGGMKKLAFRGAYLNDSE